MYKTLKAMEELETINLNKYFKDNGFVFDEDSKHTMLSLRTSIIGWINDNIDGYIANQFCKDVEHMVTFRNHNNKIQKLLEDRGFLEYARRVETQKDKELSNIAEIKSRQELRSDYSKFLNDSKMDRFTPYTFFIFLS